MFGSFFGRRSKNSFDSGGFKPQSNQSNSYRPNYQPNYNTGTPSSPTSNPSRSMAPMNTGGMFNMFKPQSSVPNAASQNVAPAMGTGGQQTRAIAPSIGSFWNPQMLGDSGVFRTQTGQVIDPSKNQNPYPELGNILDRFKGHIFF